MPNPTISARVAFSIAACVAAVAGVPAATLTVSPEKVASTAKLLGVPQKLLPSGATATAASGTAVAIGTNLALVGAPLDAARGAVFVYTRQPSGNFGFALRLVAPDGGNGDNAQFGAAVAVQGDRIVVGAPGNLGIGAAYVFRHAGGANIAFEQKLAPGDGAASDEFGVAVAVDGDTIAVGARLGNLAATNGGAVYVYTRVTTFQLQQKLTSDDAGFPSQNSAGFGSALALGGNHLHVGAPFYDGGVGSAFKFVRSGSTWSGAGQRDGGPQPARFGSSIARTPAGAVFIGAPNGVSGQAPFGIAGAVYAYDDSTGGMFFNGQVDNPANADTNFGAALAADDSGLVVGAPGFDGTGVDQGEYYRYVLAGPDVDPMLSARVAAPDPGSSDKFGAAIAFLGGAVLAGAPGDDDAQANAGAAYAFDSVVQETSLVDPAGGPDDVFGSAVAIAEDIKLVGTPHSGTVGAIEVYRREITAWTKLADDIRPDSALEQSESFFGASVAMSDDTTVVVAGAPRHDVDAPGDDRGRAFVFVRNGETWLPAGDFVAPDRADGDNFGASVAISPDGDTIVVGAPNKGAGDDGKIYVFKRAGAGAGASAKGAGFSAAGSVAGGIGDKFGAAVSVDDAGTIAVGAPLRDQSGRIDAGGLDVLRESGPGYAREPLSDAAGAAGDNFGIAVAMRNGEIAVGIPNADRVGQPATDDAGAAMMFDAGVASSTPRGRLMPADARIGDKFGSSVGISDGIAIIGAPLRDVTAAGGVMRPDAGSARLVVRAGASWNIDAEIAATDNETGASFGSSVAIRDLTLTAGAPLKDFVDNNFEDQGASYVFRIGPREPVLFESSFE